MGWFTGGWFSEGWFAMTVDEIKVAVARDISLIQAKLGKRILITNTDGKFQVKAYTIQDLFEHADGLEIQRFLALLAG